MLYSNRAVIFRSFAKTIGEVEEVAKRAIESICRSRNLFIDGERAFHRIMIAVPLDKDCGETVFRIRAEALPVLGDASDDVVIMGFKGDPNSDVLNSAIHHIVRLDEGSMGVVAIVSNKATAFMTEDVARTAFEQIKGGFTMNVVGVHITELDDALEVPIDNTFAFWRTSTLLGVGGFDSKVGVEGIAPLARLTEKYGVCSAVISGNPEAKLNVRKTGGAEYADVKGSKRERQESEAARVGVTLQWVNDHIKIIS